MNTKCLKFEKVYTYTDGQKKMSVMYFGMTEDKYLFRPYDVKGGYYNGIANSLNEKEVLKLIKEN